MINSSHKTGLSKHRQNITTRILIVDDHPLMRDSLKSHLQNQANIEIVGEAGDGEQAIKLAEELSPNVIIMDIAMPKLNGIEATKQIKAKFPSIAILVLTIHDDIEYILKILEAGAAGYLTKNIFGEDLINAIRSVISKESVLSDEVIKKLLKHALRYPAQSSLFKIQSSIPMVGEKLSYRELEILKLAFRGLSNKEISQKLNLNLGTVKGHFVNIFSKLNVGSRTEALSVGLKTGFLTIDDVE